MFLNFGKDGIKVGQAGAYTGGGINSSTIRDLLAAMPERTQIERRDDDKEEEEDKKNKIRLKPQSRVKLLIPLINQPRSHGWHHGAPGCIQNSRPRRSR